MLDTLSALIRIGILKFSILITYWHLDIYSVKLSVKNVKKEVNRSKNVRCWYSENVDNDVN